MTAPYPQEPGETPDSPNAVDNRPLAKDTLGAKWGIQIHIHKLLPGIP
jgi:hypothetical protein